MARPARVNPAEVRRIGEGLRTAFNSGDPGLIGSLLDPNVRWVGVEGCNNRDQVLDWYRDRSRYFKTAVTEVVEGEDGVVVGLAVTWPDGRQETVYHAFRVAGSLVAEIHGGYWDREEAVAEVSSG